jgi:hypothetical protein
MDDSHFCLQIKIPKTKKLQVPSRSLHLLFFFLTALSFTLFNWKHFYSFLFLFRKFEDFFLIGSFDCKLEKIAKISTQKKAILDEFVL